MIEALSGLLTSLKQTSPVIFAGVAIATGIILFGGDDVIAALGLNEFRKSYKPYLGGGFVLSISIVFSQTISSLLEFAKTRFEAWQEVRRKKKALELKKAELANLTPDEKAYLRPYIVDQATSQKLLMDDGIKGSLVAKGILHQTSSLGDYHDGWPYILQPWAREHLQENPHLLEGYTENIKTHNHWPVL